jgi:hypothetical protein
MSRADIGDATCIKSRLASLGMSIFNSFKEARALHAFFQRHPYFEMAMLICASISGIPK